MEIGSNVSFEDLQGEVNGFEKSHNLQADDAFVVWFLRAYILDDEARAIEALTGDSDERAIDAIHIDDSAKVVHIVQGKFHGKIGKHTDAAASVDQFTAWAGRLYGAQTQFTQAITGIDPSAVKKLKQARDRLVTRTGYRLVMYWVTTGRATPSTVKTAEQDVRAQGSGLDTGLVSKS